jgi:hypothetical protein
MVNSPDPLIEFEFDPSADRQGASEESAARTQANYATVYTFVIYDHDKGATATYPRMATRETIAKMRGKVNEDSAWVVEKSALDVEGFYPTLSK